MTINLSAVGLLIAASLSAQVQQLVIPSVAATRDGNSSGRVAGFMQAHRQQMLVGASWLTGVAGREITALTFRRDGWPVDHTAGSAELRVRMSTSVGLDPQQAATQFDVNLGPQWLEVFRGAVVLPASGRLPHRDAATWAPPHVVVVPLAVPYPYRGGTLCIDIEGSPVAGAVSTWWSVDHHVDPASGSRTYFGQACGSSTGWPAHTATTDPKSLRPGASIRIAGIGSLGDAAVLLLGATALPSPINLAFLGAPTCTLDIAPDVSVPSTVRTRFGMRSFGGADVALRLPLDANALGAVLYAQWAMLGIRGLSTTNAVRLQLASAPATVDAAVITSARTTTGAFPASGDLRIGALPVLQISFR